MKARRSLQIIVGILSALSLLAILGVALCIGLAVLFPNNMPLLQEGYSTLKNGIVWIARFFTIGDLTFLLPLFAYILPAELFLVATILMFLRDNGKQGKYVAGCILALIGIAISAIFTILFASDLVINVTKHVWYHAPLDWSAPDMIVRYVATCMLALNIIFVGAALGVKPKKQAVSESDEEAQPAVTDSQASENDTTYETVMPEEEAQQTASPEDEIGYIPAQEHSVSEILNGVYGQQNPVDLNKVKKARMLYDMGAITQEEFIKVVDSYTKR